MQTTPLHPPKPRRRLPVLPIVVLVVVIIYGLFAALRPLPALQPSKATANLSITTEASDLPWPSYGESAIGLVGDPVLTTHNSQKPIATASTAKLVTALMVLKKYPLSKGQSGPTITLSNADVDIYNGYIAKHGSVIAVSAGEKISEYQMLQALLIPSANNIADSLAIWAYGSLSAYQSQANQYVSQIGLHDTHIGSDASGLSPDTTSTASDLVKLGMGALKDPVLADIVAQRSATIPGVGTVINVDSLLGSDNIIGIKTGNSDQDQGIFVGAATATVNGQQVTIVSTVAGAGSLNGALQDSRALLMAGQHNFGKTVLVHKGDVLGNYKLPWGGGVQAVAAQDLFITTWQGGSAKATLKLQPIGTHSKAGAKVGVVSTPTSTFSGAASVPITLANSPDQPSFTWRLLHP